MIEGRGEFRDCPNAEEREVWTEGDEEDTAAVRKATVLLL